MADELAVTAGGDDRLPEVGGCHNGPRQQDDHIYRLDDQRLNDVGGVDSFVNLTGSPIRALAVWPPLT